MLLLYFIISCIFTARNDIRNNNIYLFMRQIELLKACTLLLSMAFATGIALTGCAEKDLYDPNAGKQELPAPETLPDFSNWSAINLRVDYEMPGCQVLIQIYTENPYEVLEDGRVVKTSKLPQFAAYTDDNGAYKGKLELPAATKTVYLCTGMMGLPECLELDVKDGKVDFKRSDLYEEEVQTRGNEGGGGKIPYEVDQSVGLYALCDWGKYGKPNSNKDKKYVTNVAGEELFELLRRAKVTLWGKASTAKPEKLDNTRFCSTEEVTNVTILREMKDESGKVVPVENAKISLTLLNESAGSQNAIGYYYYPTDSKPNAEGIKKLKKYIIFPNVSMSGGTPFNKSGNRDEGYYPKDAPLSVGDQVALKYFDKDGNASDDFPAGYTIGWFLMPNAYDPSQNNSKDRLNVSKGFLYSNHNSNKNSVKRCITLTDTPTGKLLVGFEDSGMTGLYDDKSYEDVLFYVQANPAAAIYDPNKPTTDPDPEEKPDTEYIVERTLAFEDNWPAQGDYDMNDVAVTHRQVVAFNSKNEVKKMVDTFIPVQKADAASNVNAFAFQVDAAQVGATTALPAGTIYESATHSFILFPNAQLEAGKEFVITRTFATPFDRDALLPYNPFIIVNYVAGNTQRAEVHLPKKPATSYADPALSGTQADAYYVDRDGKHPFAIDVPTMNFELVSERSAIGAQGEYRQFTPWVESGCDPKSEYAGWYKYK